MKDNHSLEKYTPPSLEKIAKQMAMVNKLIGKKESTLNTPELRLAWWNEMEEALKRVFINKVLNKVVPPTDDELQLILNMTELDLGYEMHLDRIQNISPLSKLINLKKLDLAFNQIQDISPLAKLFKLTELNLCGNEILDIAHLSKLSQLTKLDLWGNRISDITPLSELSHLTELDIYGNIVEDISPLSKLSNLVNIRSGGTFIYTTIPNGLSELPILIRLGIAHFFTNIASIGPLTIDKCSFLRFYGIKKRNNYEIATCMGVNMIVDSKINFNEPIFITTQQVRQGYCQNYNNKLIYYSVGKIRLLLQNINHTNYRSPHEEGVVAEMWQYINESNAVSSSATTPGYVTGTLGSLRWERTE